MLVFHVDLGISYYFYLFDTGELIPLARVGNTPWTGHQSIMGDTHTHHSLILKTNMQL